MLKYALLLFLIIFLMHTNAQVINNSYAYRNMPGDKYVRFCYENDFFTATDRFYTQGIYLEYASPGLKKLPVYKILLAPGNYVAKHSITLQHNAYTPQSIQDPNLRIGDRPYAAAFMLQFNKTVINTKRQEYITTAITAGVLGQIAGGEWMQKGIHKALGNVQPRGWKYQIANDLVLNYKIQYEKNLWYKKDIFTLNATGSADAGTLLNKLSAGINITAGYFDIPGISTDGNKKFTIRLYTHPQVHVVGYDATLQGGLFNKNSPYTIAPNAINRLVADNYYGIAIQAGNVYLEYSRCIISREFITGKPHAWGGVQVGICF